jgi:succinyl-CoA synthetase beta subunit
MRIHEYQAKRLIAASGVPVPRGEVAATPEQARVAAGRVGGAVVVKAQILAGGRGKAGGIVPAASPVEAEAAAARLLAKPLVTAQTGPEGRVVRRVLVEEAVDVERELYLGLTIDRSRAGYTLLASPHGGVDVETLAAGQPGFVLEQTIRPAAGLLPAQADLAAAALGPSSGEASGRAKDIAAALVRAFEAMNATLLEINPLVLTRDGRLVAADAKAEIDDNALPFHPGLRELRDPAEGTPAEREAAADGLSFVKLDGDVGCVVNGAGLAMATMDLVALAGGRPANFLDIGGGVSEDAVARAFVLLASDPAVRSVLVNIFGGIVRCDLVVRGLVRAARGSGVSLPVVMRLEGTNVEEARSLLTASALPFALVPDMEAAAREAVRLARAAGGPR